MIETLNQETNKSIRIGYLKKVMIDKRKEIEDLIENPQTPRIFL